MKKALIFLAAVALVSMAFVGCKKSCTCTALGTTTTNEKIETEEDCNALNTATQLAGGSCSWS